MSEFHKSETGEAVYYDNAVSGLSSENVKDAIDELKTLIVAGSGDVVGPASSVDNTIPRFDGVTGKLLQGSLVVIEDSGIILPPAGTALLPAYGFADEPGSDTGMYWIAAGTIGWSSQGNLAMQLDPGGDLTIQGNFDAANYPPTGSNNTFAGFNGSGDLYSPTGFSINTTSLGMDIGLTEQPNNGGGNSVNTTYVNFDPIANSPNESWLIYNIQANLDVNSSGFTQGTNGSALTLINLGANHQGTGDIGGFNFLNTTATFGNGTDPITLKYFNISSSFLSFNANTTLDGSINGYGLNVNVNSGAFSTTNFGGQGFYDNLNVQVPMSGWNSANFSPNILSINNNTGYTSLNINPTIPTFTGNANYNGVGVSGTITTFGTTGGFNGVFVNPQITTMGSSGYWNGIEANGQITTSHGNVTGFRVSTTVNGGDANFTGMSINPQGSATLPSVEGLNINVSALASSAQKYSAYMTGGKLNVSSPYHTNVLPASPGYLDMNSIGGELWIKSGSPMSSTLVLSNNMGQTSIFEDNMGPDGFGGLIGYCGNALLMQGGVATTKTVDTVTGVIVGFNVADLTGLSITDGGTITKSSMISVIGMSPGGGSVTVGDLYGVNILPIFGNFATNSWGFYNDSNTENYFEKSLALGTTSKKVTNADIALEVGSDKAIRFAVMNTTTRDGLTAVDGMTIFNTTTNLIEFFDGTDWQGVGSGGNLDGGTSNSVYGGTTPIDGGGA